MSFDLGDVATVSYRLTVNGTLTDATVTLTVTDPAGGVSVSTPRHDGVGLYSADLSVTVAGVWTYTFTASGAAQDTESGSFRVLASSATLISLDEIKAALNKTLSVDDEEITRQLRAAEAEYAEYVSPVGTITETFSGGSDRLVLRAPRVTALTAAAYTDGTTISLTDLNLDPNTGIVYWGYNTAGYFTWGTRNVTLTYTAADLPANHREAIIADVAGYFEATQRGPLGPDDTGYSGAYTNTPTVLFPRIRALAPPRVG